MLLLGVGCKEVPLADDREQPVMGDARAARAADAGPAAVRPFRGPFGSITDAVSGEPLEAASVRYISADPGAESEGFVQEDFAVVTVTEPKGYYSYEGGFPRGVVRVEVDAQGYEPLLTYITHLDTERCDGGPCSRHDFALWPKGHAHQLLPDLLPNSSYVHASRVKLTNQCDGRAGVATCLRASVGVANMARGDLFLSASAEAPNEVVQHLFSSDGSTTEHLLEGEFGEDPNRQTILLPGWVRLGMRKIDETCAKRESAEECPIVRESLLDVACMRDYVLVEPRFESDHRYDCVVTEAGQIEQGIGPGQMDFSDSAIPGQFVDVTGLSNGEYWLEVEVNPKHVVQEADYANNVGRTRYELELPECGDGKIDEPESCEGSDLDDASCRSIDERFAGGELRCSEHCGFDRSDCELAACDPVDIGSALGSVAEGELAEARNTTSPVGCALPTGSGKDVAFSWTAPESGPYSITEKLGALFISVREETCDGAELTCVTEGAWAGLAVDLKKGQTVVIVLDALPGREGLYELQINSLK